MPRRTGSFVLMASSPAARGSVFERFSYMPLSSGSFDLDWCDTRALYSSGIAVVSPVGPVVGSQTMDDKRDDSDCYCMSQAMTGKSDTCAYCQERKKKADKKAEVKVVYSGKRGGKGIRMGLLYAKKIVNDVGDEMSGQCGPQEAIRKILYRLATATLEIDIDELCAKMQTSEQKEAVRRLMEATPEQLGNAARVAGNGLTVEEKNKILQLAQEQFNKRDYTAEMLLRGLVIRSDKVNEAVAKAEELEGRLKFTYERMDKKTEISRNLLAQLNKVKAEKDAADLKVHQLKDELAKQAAGGQKQIEELTRVVEKIVARELDGVRWKSADGTKRLPHEFTDEHLLNTIRFIERRLEEKDEEPETCYSAEGSWKACDRDGIPRVYLDLLAEARSRKLLLAKDRVKAQIVETTEEV